MSNSTDSTNLATFPLRLALMSASDIAKRSSVDMEGVAVTAHEDGTFLTFELDSTTEGAEAWRDGLTAAGILGIPEVAHGHGWTEWSGIVDSAQTDVDVTIIAYYDDETPIPLRSRLRRHLTRRPVGPAILLGLSAAAGSALTLVARRVVATR